VRYFKTIRIPLAALKLLTLANPLWLLLALVWPLAYWWQRNSGARPRTMPLPTASALVSPVHSWRIRWRKRLPWMLHIALALCILAMARPQKAWQEERINSDGIDIMLTMDISLSMLSRDFKPNRLAVTKAVASSFVDKRPNDRIGLVVFAGEAFTHCPLTPDKRVVKEFIQNVRAGILKWETAVGDGVATALNRLKNSTAKSKIVVLLTDGDSNAGVVAPEEAAQIAADMGIKVYTIAIGEEGIVEMPYSRIDDTTFVYQPVQSTINTGLLERMAQMTQARFFRAYTPEDLNEIYAEIDRLEKTNIDVTTIQRSTDYFHIPVLLALALVCAYVVLRAAVLRSVLE
jgi:Ca-activated chloride channel homolog